jgi:integrase
VGHLARLKFTDGALKKLTAAPKERLAYFDTRGSGLAIRVSGPAGRREGDAKTFGVPYRGPGGVQRWVTLRPDFPVLSLKEAEKQAIQLLARVSLGEDPAADRARARAAPPARADTMANVVAAFCEVLPNRRHEKTGRLLSAKHVANTTRHLKRVADHWGDRDIRTIEEREILDFLEEIGAVHLVTANRVHASLRTLFGWAAQRGMVAKGTMSGLKRVGSERARERVLSSKEIPVVWAAAAALGYPYGHCLRMLLACGQRLGEVSRMRWRDIDGDLWTIPASETKADRAQTVPLSGLARAILEEGDCRKFVDGGFVFAGRNPRRPVAAFGNVKSQLDEKIAELCRQRGEPTLRDWHLHDLRRTCATELGGLGVGRFIIERILNHADGGVTAIYDLHTYDTEKREALEKWATRLRSLVEPPPDNLIELQPRIAR